MSTFKNIHIGSFIEKLVKEKEIDHLRILNFFKHEDTDFIEKSFSSESIDANLLLKWSKLLEYDFFRIYSQHLILYAPPSALFNIKENTVKSSLPVFRKNIYTREIIEFILERIAKGDMSKQEVIEQYRIPKTTLYKWLNKYKT